MAAPCLLLTSVQGCMIRDGNSHFERSLERRRDESSLVLFFDLILMVIRFLRSSVLLVSLAPDASEIFISCTLVFGPLLVIDHLEILALKRQKTWKSYIAQEMYGSGKKMTPSIFPKTPMAPTLSSSVEGVET